jgi:O-antigen/teichoic acid export membrane protein
MTPDTPRPAVVNLLTGTAVKYILLAANIVIGLFMMPFTVGHLGKAQYGLWMIVASMTAYFQLLDLGYGGALVRYVADADAKHDHARVNEVVSTFAVVYAAIGALALAGVALLAIGVVPRFPGIPGLQVHTAQIVLLILGLRVAIGFPMTVFGAVTTSRQYFALNGFIALAVVLANAAATYLVLSAGHGLVTLVAATTAITIASYGAYALSARYAFPPLRIRLSSFRRVHVRDVTQFSLYLFIIDVAIQIGFNLDNLVVGAALGTSAVAVYAVTLRLAEYQRLVCNQFNGLLFPVVVRFEARGDLDALRHTMIEGTRLAFALVAGATVCLIGLGPSLVSTWMGPDFADAVGPLYVLAMTGVVLVAQGPLGNVLLATGRHRLVAFASLGEALANLALSVLLVRRYGLMGVAIGTAVPVFVANLVVLLPAACRRVGIGVWPFLRATTGPGLAAAVPASLLVVWLRTSFAATSLLIIALQATLVTAGYLLALASVGLSRKDRARYFGYVRQITRVGSPRIVTT